MYLAKFQRREIIVRELRWLSGTLTSARSGGSTVGEFRSLSDRVVISSVPQYVERVLVSGVIVPPSPQTRARLVTDPAPRKADDEDEDEEQEEKAGPSLPEEPPRGQEVLLMIKEKTSSQLRAQKESHVKELSLKKNKLQKLLQKLDNRTSCPRNDHTCSLAGGEEGESQDSTMPDETGRTMTVPGDRQRENSGERTLYGHSYKEHGSTPVHLSIDHYKRTSATDEEDDCLDPTMDRANAMIHQCWRRIFQVISFPLSLISVFIIELVNFIAQSVIKRTAIVLIAVYQHRQHGIILPVPIIRLLFTSVMKMLVLIVGLIAVVGDHVIAPLAGALFKRVLQPVVSCLLRVSGGVRDVLQPLLSIARELVLQISLLVQSFRLVEIHQADRPHNRQDSTSSAQPV